MRGTKKLRDRVKSPPADMHEVSTTVLGDWFAMALIWKPQVALLVSETTFVAVLLPLAPAATLLDRIPAAIASTLRRHGVDESIVAAELAAMSEVRIASTNNRSVLGVMNDFSFHAEIRYLSGSADLEDVAVGLAGIPIGPLHARTGFPDRELAAVLGNERSNVIPFPSVATTPVTAKASPAARSTKRVHGSVFQLKVTLSNTKPPIWRRVLVDGSATLDQVHEVIQAALGWWNYHLHEFEVGRSRYSVPDPDDDDFGFGPPAKDERRVRLDKIASIGSTFTYTYDFGDNWVHKVKVEKVHDATAVTPTPACIDGRRAAPPEDCGGPWGYGELLTILADPTHPEHTERIEWVEGMGGRGAFDPEAFDPAEFDDNLQNVHLAVFDD